ncbi:methylated-DNA--[protein]-cysteine S-methyltransferase [Leadbetterella sp. DM7]|uniref:methylated-DNA--[protein]-cysteine S-methyltransferase n=1 Tax=Leadbetterella sp. DM7 TaxID=3235085 RepID=UPI00349E665E
MEETFETYVSASGKTLKIVSDAHSVKDISFVEEKGPDSSTQPEILEKAARQLEEYLSGKRETFDLKLDPDGTDFQKKVWDLLQTIPFGKTKTYAWMADQLGDPKVIRAAASANGKNPIAVVIPCHRVIGSDGSLTGYAGGLDNKRFLLELERANGVLTLFN